jgi:hypothetical protein
VELKGKFQVGGITRVLSIQSVIRAIIPAKEGASYGVEFFEKDEDKLLVLLGFIFHSMVFGHTLSIS